MQFFEAYGPSEAASMCYLLATSDKQSMVSCKCITGERGLEGGGGKRGEGQRWPCQVCSHHTCQVACRQRQFKPQPMELISSCRAKPACRRHFVTTCICGLQNSFASSCGVLWLLPAVGLPWNFCKQMHTECVLDLWPPTICLSICLLACLPAICLPSCLPVCVSVPPPQSLVHEAAAALENPSLVGQPALQEDAGGPEAYQNIRAAEGGMYMGS